MILDAQDYLDKWHLAVICKVDPTNDTETIKVNFLPYPKGNRDEWISATELVNRLCGPYSMIEHDQDKEKIIKNIASLQEYSKKFIKPGSKEEKHE